MGVNAAIVGGGQLARLMALRGLQMGWHFRFLLEPGENTSSVSELGEVVERREGESGAQLFERLGKPEWITVERESLPFALLRELGELCPQRPAADTVAIFADRITERRCLQQLDIPVAPNRVISQPRDIRDLFDGKPLVIKTSQKGYDGRGQWRVRSAADAEQFATTAPEQDYLVEDQISFHRELSLLGVRGVDGSTLFYPPAENLHRNGILVTSLAPAPALNDDQAALLRNHLQRLMTSLDYVGVMAMECFDTPTGLMVNEIAPRVHNSGHWTSLGCQTDQFENHLRAVAGLPLGSTRQRGVSGMLNLLGGFHSDARALQDHGQLYLYNKQPRPGRKLGHLCLADDDINTLSQRLAQLDRQLYGDGAASDHSKAAETTSG